MIHTTSMRYFSIATSDPTNSTTVGHNNPAYPANAEADTASGQAGNATRRITNADTAIIPNIPHRIPRIAACTTGDCLMSSSTNEAVTIKIAGGVKIAAVPTSAPTTPSTKPDSAVVTFWAMNVAITKMGPGVTWLNAMPSRNCCVLSHP